MENCLFIGTKVDEQTATYLAEFVSKVFESGAKYHMEQATIVAAFELVGKYLAPYGTSVSNCSFVGEKNVTIESDTVSSK